jgi:Family of unknown function (DUF5681)
MGRERTGDYQVGFGKPPKERQFRKGQSGNPKGRPRGSRNASTLLDELLKERVVVSENGRRREMTKLEAILKQLVNRAAQGDHRATQLLLAHQIPRIEQHEASRSAMAERSPLPPPPSAEETRQRHLEIAKILHAAGAISTGSDEASDYTPEWQAELKKPQKPE